MKSVFLAAFLILTPILLKFPLFAQDSPQPQAITNLEPITSNDSILILAPHPDDEAIACAGIIQRAVAVGAKVKVVYLTNGDSNELAFIVYEKRLTFKKGEFLHMGEVRKKEATAAMKFLGLNENDLVFLGYPDFGTFTMFTKYWNTDKPFKSLLTRVSSVPYKDDLSFGASYVGESVLFDLKTMLLKYKPNKIFVSHPTDVNADHRALYLFLQVALQELKTLLPATQTYSYLVHSVGWPLPRHYHPDTELLPPKKFSTSQVQWQRFDLTAQEIENKNKAILFYKSQTNSSAFYLLSFARKNELFGDYPEISLAPQVSLKEKGAIFFGFSNMYRSSKLGVMEDVDNFIDETSQASYAVVDNFFLIRIQRNKPFGRNFNLLLYVFGCKQNKSFSLMPKLRIIARYNKFKVFDGKKLIPAEGLLSELNDNTIVLKIPLQFLGDPDFILTAIKSYRGLIPIDAVGFRKVSINK